jgi:hypothetical protein
MSQHLDISVLESWLWEAACVIRGPVDAPKLAQNQHSCHQPQTRQACEASR